MIVAWWGDEKTWKSSAGLSFPKPLFHMDLDVGGFERAAWRLDSKLRIYRCKPEDKLDTLDWSKYDIVTKPYPVPVQMEKLMGLKTPAPNEKGASVRFPRRVIGYKEVWQQIVVDYVAACQNPIPVTIMWDSATQLWSICHTSLLQEKQEIQIAQGKGPEHSEFREKLQPVEYPNDRMRSLIYTARSFGKNLAITHYPKDVYGERFDADGRKQEYRTGEITLDGFKHTQQLVDLVIKLNLEMRTNIISHEKEPVVVATITKCGLPGLGTAATGKTLIDVSYQGILDLIEESKPSVS